MYFHNTLAPVLTNGHSCVVVDFEHIVFLAGELRQFLTLQSSTKSFEHRPRQKESCLTVSWHTKPGSICPGRASHTVNIKEPLSI